MNVPKRKSLKPIPSFSSEDEEREFWATHDSAEHLDWSRAQRATFSRLKPSTQTISLRLPELLVENLKLLANKRDVPYQSLLKIFLAERVQKELDAGQSPAPEGRGETSRSNRSRMPLGQSDRKIVATLHHGSGIYVRKGAITETLPKQSGAKSLHGRRRRRPAGKE